MGHGSDHGHAPVATLSAEEFDLLRKEDGKVGTRIVCLLTGIFSIGLVLYLGVCYWITSGL